MECNILKGPINPFPQESFGCLLYRSLHTGKSNVAMVDGTQGEEVTYEEMCQYTVSLAQYLKKLGLTSNDAIAMCSTNSHYFTIVAVAALYLGVKIGPINPFYTPQEIIHAMNIIQPKIIFCSSTALDNVIQATKEVKIALNIVVLDKSTNLPNSVHTLQQYMNYPRTAIFHVTSIHANHVAVIMCSSGTTGVAKGVMITHKNLCACYNLLIDPNFTGLHSGKIGLASLPFYHIYGLTFHLNMLATNMKIVVLPRFGEHLFLNAIQHYRVTFMNIVPSLILFLSKHPLVDKYDLSSLEDIISGGSPLGKDIQEDTMKRLSLQSIRQGYGLTETTAGIVLTPKHKIKCGSVGIITPNMEMKVRDVSTNKALGPNQTGEVCFRGPLVMKGYVGNSEATSETIDSEGWLVTGDAGYYDTDGYLYIVDRYKELIKYKSHQVAPAEIEAILVKHPQIKECAVIGKPDSAAGEVPVAFVVTQTNGTISEKDVINYVAENVSFHKRLHDVRFVNEIPKNTTGKILRRLLKEQL